MQKPSTMQSLNQFDIVSSEDTTIVIDHYQRTHNMQSINIHTVQSKFVGALDFDITDQGLVPRRLPAFTRKRAPEEMQRVISTPSGIRFEFQSDTTEVQLDVHLSLIKAGRNVPCATIDLTIDGEGVQSQSHQTGDILSFVSISEMQREPGSPVCFKFSGLPKGSKNIALWLPVNAVSEIRGLRIDVDASFNSVKETKPIWVHHGSSISQCSEAYSPTQTWPAIAAKLGKVSLQSLGFGGQCHLDQFVAQTIRDLPADYISLKIGINIVNQNSLGRRTFATSLHGFLDTIRSVHLRTPIILVSPIFCPFSEDTPGPTTASIRTKDGKKQLVFGAIAGHEEVRQNALNIRQMRSIIEEVVRARRGQGDASLGYIDGLSLFSEADKGDLPDDLHPNGAGYLRMGQRFADIAFDCGMFSQL
ncbi:MAG: hypothetical protein ACI9CE_001880 [Flavobacterium sp.]|jgi:hypothetical protein